MQQLKYDLVVIGGGAAGEKGSSQAAYFGKKVALVEEDIHLGGATAGTTVSSKTLRETSLILSGYRARKLYGVDLILRKQATVQDLLRHEKFVKRTERGRVLKNMIHHNVDLFHGKGSFYADKKVIVEFAERDPILLDAEVVLLASGSSPRRPPDFPDDKRIYDSESILQLDAIPRNMVVVGGGVIGCEYACIFKALDIDVYLVHTKDRLLPFLDDEIAAALRRSMQTMGIHLLMPDKIHRCRSEKAYIRVELESGARLQTEAVMLATGRRSNTVGLNLEAAGIRLNDDGLVPVNRDFQVINPDTLRPIPGIYAAGDVVGAPALASTSMEQARYAVIKAFKLHPYKKAVAPILPLGIYTIPECSGAGYTEVECRRKEIDYVVGKADYAQNPRGMIIGDFSGFLKLLYTYSPSRKTPMKLLGVHVIGETATEIIHIGLMALMTGATHELFMNTCFNYPTLSELYKYATYDAMGKRDQRIRMAQAP